MVNLQDWQEINIGNDTTLKARIGWQGLTTGEYKDSGEYYLVTGTDFENGFVKGFEEGAKHSEDFWNKLQETELDEEDFTREYLQEKCNQYLKSDGKNI